MKRSILITLALIATISIFVLPGSTQDKSADHVQKNSGDNKGLTNRLVAPVIKSNPSPEDENKSAEVADQNVERRVRIGTPVEVNSIKDPWDKSLVFFTGLIVIVGIFQIWFLWKTVKATSDNAKAARMSAEAMIKRERARVLAEDVSDIFYVVATAKGGCKITLKNYGSTPAILVAHNLGFRVTEIDGPGDSWENAPNIYKNWKSDGCRLVSKIMAPGQPYVIQVEGNVLNFINGEESPYFLELYGIVIYKDVFLDDRAGIHETRFCLNYGENSNPGGALWWESGEQEWNLAT